MAASPILAPEEEIAVEEKIRKVYEPALKPKPSGPKQRLQALLLDTFEGQEDLLGWTPD